MSSNFRILRFDQTGLLFRSRKKWIPRSTAKCEDGSSSLTKVLQNGVPFEYIFHAVCVFFYGIVTGISAILIEKYLWKKNTKNNNIERRLRL